MRGELKMKAIVLAAGMGKRLHSEEFNLPKVLRCANGKPLVGYVLDGIDFIKPEDIVIVAGYMREKVIETLGDNYSYAVQEEQKGTGHAVQCAKDYFDGYDGDVLVLYGDMPLFTKETFKAVIDRHIESGADCTLLTADIEDPPTYGRIVRDADGNLEDIVEDKDCTPEQKAITELNVGVYVFKSKLLFDGLKEIKNANAQGEYYLTDMPKIFISQGRKVASYTIKDSSQIYGVSTEEDLAFCEDILSKR